MRPILFSIGTQRAFSGLRLEMPSRIGIGLIDVAIDLQTLHALEQESQRHVVEFTDGYARLYGVHPAFTLGTSVRLSRTLDLLPYALFQAGELGIVEHVNGYTGEVDIKMQALHHGLASRANCAWLVPFGTDDILGAFDIVTATMDGVATAVA